MPTQWSTFVELRTHRRDLRNEEAYRHLAQEVTRGKHAVRSEPSPFVTPASMHQGALRQEAALHHLRTEALRAQRSAFPDRAKRSPWRVLLLLQRGWRWRPF